MNAIGKHDNVMTKLQKAFPGLAQLKKGVKDAEVKIGKGGDVLSPSMWKQKRVCKRLSLK